MNKLNVPLEEVIKKENEQKGPEAMGKYTKSIIHGVKMVKDVEAPLNKDFTKVFVGNLSYQTSWQDLKDFMKTAGDVLYADVFMDSYGKSKGCGYFKFFK